MAYTFRLRAEKSKKASVGSVRHASKAMVPEVKVKRKCGRPRNPIPRHKRVSHINAEHRRRGKIQNGFQTLKNMVPKYESSGRDSKADILTKAVAHCKAMKKQCREQERQLKELRAQQQALNADIERHHKTLPEGQFLDDQPLTSEQRLDDLIAKRTEDNWRYYLFSFIMKPLHETFDKMTDCSTRTSFVESSIEWARQNMSQSSLRPVVLEALRNLSTQTSIMASPELLPTEALQHCRRRSSRSIPATVTSTSSFTFTSTSTSTSAAHHHSSQELELTPKHLSHVHEHSSSTSGHKHQSSHKQPPKSYSGSKRSSSARPEEGVQLVPPAKKSRSRPSPPPAPLQNVPFEASTASVKLELLPSCSSKSERTRLAVKTEPVSQLKVETVAPSRCASSTPPTAELFLRGLDSPASYDSAMGLSPPGSSHESSSVFSDLAGYESAPDQGYDTPSFSFAASPLNPDFFKHRLSAATSPDQAQSVFADLEDMSSSDFVDTICESYESSSMSSSPVGSFAPILPHSHSQHLHQQLEQQQQQQQQQHCDVDNPAQLPLESAMFLDQVDANYLMDNVDQQLLSDPSVLDMPCSRSFLNVDSGSPFDLLMECAYDASEMGMGDSSLLSL